MSATQATQSATQTPVQVTASEIEARVLYARKLPGGRVETTLTDAEALEAAGRIPGTHRSYGFAQGMIRDYRKYGGLFPERLAWLHFLALQQVMAEFRELTGEEAPKPEVVQPAAAGSYPGIAAFLTPVSGHLKSGASVTFTVDGRTVQIKRAGQQSKHPGSFWVTDGRGYGSSTLYGRIGPDGSFTRYNGFDGWVGDLLSAFDRDPKGYAAVYGVRTGKCCFCNTPLTDPASAVLGYGPVCAKHYGLPHGKAAVAAAEAARSGAGK
jgi:hypothetical protein